MINREKYKQWISKNHMHTWSCPSCHEGILEYEDKNFNCIEDSDYHKYSSEPSYQVPNDINFRYTLVLKCINPSCQESVVNIGQYSIERIQEYNEYGEIIDVDHYHFIPKYFYPPLHLFQIPEGTPKEVEKNIKASFSLFFSNPPSAANYIRVALESLLTSLKVKRFDINKKRERKKIFLHKRIDLLPSKYENIQETCKAIKWLGNEGSHSDSKITIDDVLDGYDMFSTILEELYEEKTKKITKIVKKINTKKGV